METKYEAIEHFTFMKRVYDKVTESGFVEKGGDENVNLCGVFFHKQFAYSTNMQIIGRTFIDDNLPMDEPVFWRYGEEERDTTAAKFLLNFKGYCEPSKEASTLFNEMFLGNLEWFFNRHTTDCFFVRRDYIVDTIEQIYGEKEAAKIKTYVDISLSPRYEIKLDFKPIKPTPTNQPTSRKLSLFSNPDLIKNIKVTGDYCRIMVYYLYNIMKYSFPKGSIVGIKFSKHQKDLPPAPAVLFNKKLNIYWAVAQKLE